MKLPLFCYTCDMITGHESTSFLKARCRKCGTYRTIPVHKWILIAIALIALLGVVTWWMIQMFHTFFF